MVLAFSLVCVTLEGLRKNVISPKRHIGKSAKHYR